MTLLHICLFLCTTGVASQTFRLQPLNPAVLLGSDVQFSATVEGIWQVMTWHVRGFLVLTVPADNNVTSSSPQFSARFCSAGDLSCVEFTIHNVTRRDAGPVTCIVQGEYGSQTAQLSVQESGTVSIPVGNRTVDQDQEVEFQCVTTAWFPTPTISWTQNRHPVNSSLYHSNSTEDGDLFNSTSVLKFQAVRNTTVECHVTVPALRNPRSSSVFLVVVPKPPDWTVLIAVVVSFAGVALLALLIIGIVFCYKRRKEKQSSYQDEMSRRVRTQSQISTVSAAARRRAQANAGFVPEDQTSVAPSELSDGSFYQAHGPSVLEMPEILNTNQTGTGLSGDQRTVDASGFRKHRHVTIV